MKILIKKSHLVTVAFGALVLSACGISNDTAGIGGSGYISSGSISSFGSVFVNGVEFETNSSTFEIEDASGTQADLRIGMVVEVTGSINADGITGSARHIKYGDDLEGPVSNLDTRVVGITRFMILGNKVVVSEVSTTFENTNFASIAEGNVLEVSGFYDQDNVLQASYIDLKSNISNADTIFEVKGIISNLSANNFQIKNVAINASIATYEYLPNGLENGLFVEVKGKFVNNVLVATEIEREDSFSDDANVELEGIITRYVDHSDFDINGQSAVAENANFSPVNLILKLGMKVEVKGMLTNGVFIASEVQAREGSAGVSAMVNSKSENSFTVEVLSGQLVTVQLTTATRMKDDLGLDDNLFLSELGIGDFVSVQGFESASDTITATEIKRESEIKETQLQGIVTAASISDFTVLDVIYPVSESTSYSGADNNAAFINLIEPGVSVINISDETPDEGGADEIEIED